MEKVKYKWPMYRGKKCCCYRANLILLHCYISEEYHNHQDDGRQPNGNFEEHEPVRVCDVIRITGKRENCEAAQKALLDLVPVTLEVSSERTPLEAVICSCNRNVIPFVGSKGALLCSQYSTTAHLLAADSSTYSHPSFLLDQFLFFMLGTCMWSFPLRFPN